ncbi:MAG TPA: DUF4386 domain-containing protein [Candidatus Limnocylindrales bacterium]|nr:DUF4386 domain-containing protein [Candidatus Limnocylindrales bacterium]
MNAHRRLAIVAGIMFIVATVANVASAAMVSPILNATDYLTQVSVDQTRVLVSALLEFVGGVACTGIALALFPVLRPHNEGLALGAVAFRTIEGALYVLIAVCLTVLVTISREGLASSDQAGALVLATRDALGPVGVLTFGLGGLMYYLVFFRTRLIPLWLSVWGLIGVVLVMASAVLVMLGAIDNFSTAQIALAAPIGLQEMVLAVYLIAKGFRAAPVASEPARRPRVQPAAS